MFVIESCLIVFNILFNTLITGSIQENEPAWSEQTRRDMLSLNVEFVKINISRSRKIELRSSDKEAKSNIVRFSGTNIHLFIFLSIFLTHSQIMCLFTSRVINININCKRNQYTFTYMYIYQMNIYMREIFFFDNLKYFV